MDRIELAVAMVSVFPFFSCEFDSRHQATSGLLHLVGFA
jgi:hypothetical protein